MDKPVRRAARYMIADMRIAYDSSCQKPGNLHTGISKPFVGSNDKRTPLVFLGRLIKRSVEKRSFNVLSLLNNTVMGNSGSMHIESVHKNAYFPPRLARIRVVGMMHGNDFAISRAGKKRLAAWSFPFGITVELQKKQKEKPKEQRAPDENEGKYHRQRQRKNQERITFLGNRQIFGERQAELAHPLIVAAVNETVFRNPGHHAAQFFANDFNQVLGAMTALGF